MENSFLPYLLLAGAAFYIFKIMKSGYDGGRNPESLIKHCMTCGTEAAPKTATKGNDFIEVILWLPFILPGLIYSIWRRNNRVETCATCHSLSIVPMDAPAAVKHRRDLA